MRISLGVIPVFTILAVAALAVPATHAQSSDNISNSAAACADVKPPVADPVDTIDGVPIYLIAPGKPSHQSVCLATEALEEGMVDVSLNDDSVLADALDASTPETATGTASKSPYLPGPPFFGTDVEIPENSHVYGAFIDPDTGVEYIFSSVADNTDEMAAAGEQWISSTVVPLLEHSASNAATLAVSDAAFASAAITDGPPSYSNQAWDLLVDATVTMPDNKVARILVHGHDRVVGSSGADVKIYRLNASKGDNDYFLVDTRYTQTPRYDPFNYYDVIFNTIVKAWANKTTQLTLTSTNPLSTKIQPVLSEFAPQNAVTSNTETFTVGATLTGHFTTSGVNAGYSVTRTQQSVDTAVDGGIGTNKVQWFDTYNGFPVFDFLGYLVPPPDTSKLTFTGERLAIYKVPRTINDNIPAGQHAGLDFTPALKSGFVGYYHQETAPKSLNPLIDTGWTLTPLLFAPEPQFSASPLTIQVSKSKNNDSDHPVIVKVVAELSNESEKVTWKPELPVFVGSNVSSAGKTGSADLEIWAKPEATTSDSGIIFLNSSPIAATDSLRNGAISIKVKIVP